MANTLMTPIGQVAMNGLDPDYQQALMAKYGATPAPEAPPELLTQSVAGLSPRFMTPETATDVPVATPIEPVVNADYVAPYKAPVATMTPAMTVLTGVGQFAADAKAETSKAYAGVEKSAMEAAKAEANVYAEQAKQQEKIAKQITADMDAEKTIRDQESSAVSDAVSTAKNLEDNWRKSTVDPKRWWASKETGEKAQAMIAVLLGNLGGALLGQGLAGNKMIDRLIDQDIELQKGERAQQEGIAKQAWRQVDDQRQVFAGESAQRATARLHRLTALEKQTESFVLNARSDLQKKNGAALQQQIAMKKQEAMNQIGMTAMKEVNDMMLKVGINKMGVPPGADPKSETNYGYANDITSAGKVKDAEAARGTLKTAIQRARDTIEKYGTWSPGGEGAARIADAERTVFKAFQAAFNSGVLNKDEADRYKEMSGLSLFNSNTFAQEQLNLLEEEAENNFKNVVDANILPKNRINQGPKRAPSER